MESNTRQIVDLYKQLGDKIGPDGEPILAITQVQQVTVTTYMQKRMFDPNTAVEASPLLIPIDISAMDESITETQSDLNAISAIQGLVAQVSPSTPVKIKPIATPTQPITG